MTPVEDGSLWQVDTPAYFTFLIGTYKVKLHSFGKICFVVVPKLASTGLEHLRGCKEAFVYKFFASLNLTIIVAKIQV